MEGPLPEGMKGVLSITADKKVKLEVFTGFKAIPRVEKDEFFPVLVRVTAPESAKDSRVPVDIVAVLDVSFSMEGERLESLKKAMEFVIDDLGEEDRLSVVSFQASPRRLTGLSEMSAVRREEARNKVNSMAADDGTDIGNALEEAIKILSERRAEEAMDRPGCIILLSDGEDSGIFQRTISRQFQVHTFGLSEGHDAKVMRHIADHTSGVYSFIRKDMKQIKEAFAMCIGGLTTVAAMSIVVSLQADEGVSIQSIESGGYESCVSPDKQSGTVKIDDLYAGETKNFVVYLVVPEGKEPSLLHFLPFFSGNTTKLLFVGGTYKNPKIAKREHIELDRKEANVARPEELPNKEREISPEVAAELARIQLLKEVAAMVDKGIPYPYAGQLQNVLDGIKNSDYGKAAGQQVLSGLMEDIKEMEDGIADANTHRTSGLPYMLSWLTSQQRQRATTKGSPSKADAFQTGLMKETVKSAVNPQPVVPKPSDGAIGTRLWNKVSAWVRSKTLSSHALSIGLVVLLVSFLLNVYCVVVNRLGSSGAQDKEPTPAIATVVVICKIIVYVLICKAIV